MQKHSRRHLPKRRRHHPTRRRHLLEQNDEWTVQRCRYMTLESVASLSDDATVGLHAVAV
jgi:hypothetical protein